MTWMSLYFVVPKGDGDKLLEFAEKELDLKQLDEDWTVHKREIDNVILDYAYALEPDDRKVDW